MGEYSYSWPWPLPARAKERSPREPVRRLPRGQATYVVLYIEDLASNVRLMQRILRDRPAVRMVEARYGRDGLALAREQRPDLILLDLHLPDISGKEVVQLLHADEHTRDIPIVIISADAMAEQVEELLQMGVSDYLTKPISVKQLQELLDYLLGEGERYHAPDLPA